MINNIFINTCYKLAISTFLKIICTRINIKSLNIFVSKSSNGKIEEFFFEANNLIYRNLYITSLIIKSLDFNLKINYKNYPIFSDDLFINVFLKINNEDLGNMFFAKKLQSLRIKIQDVFTEGYEVSDINIRDQFINLKYLKENIKFEKNISFYKKNNYIFLENEINKEKFSIPFEEKIKFKKLYIKNHLLDIELTSKVKFEN